MLHLLSSVFSINCFNKTSRKRIFRPFFPSISVITGSGQSKVFSYRCFFEKFLVAIIFDFYSSLYLPWQYTYISYFSLTALSLTHTLTPVSLPIFSLSLSLVRNFFSVKDSHKWDEASNQPQPRNAD